MIKYVMATLWMISLLVGAMASEQCSTKNDNIMLKANRSGSYKNTLGY